MGILPMSATVALVILLLAMTASSTQVEYPSDDIEESSRAEPLYQLDRDDDMRSHHHSRLMDASKQPTGPEQDAKPSDGYNSEGDDYSSKFGFFNTNKPFYTSSQASQPPIIKHVVHYPDGSVYEVTSNGNLKPISLSAGVWSPQQAVSTSGSSAPVLIVNAPGQRPGYAPGYPNYLPGSWNDGVMDYSKYPPVMLPQNQYSSPGYRPQGYPNAPYAPGWQNGYSQYGQYQPGWSYRGSNPNYPQYSASWGNVNSAGSDPLAPQINIEYYQPPYTGASQNYPNQPGWGYGGVNSNRPYAPNYYNYPQMYQNYPQGSNSPGYSQWLAYGQYPQGQYSPMGSQFWGPNGGPPFSLQKKKHQLKHEKISSKTKDS